MLKTASIIARLIKATSIVDRAYQAFVGARAAGVAAYASDAVLDSLNELGYGRDRTYDPTVAAFRAPLFPWEEMVVDRFFPAPPARVLVGGAGGGREIFPLAERGYSLVGFDPIAALGNAILAAAPAEADIVVFRGTYERLPILEPLDDGPPVRVDDLAPFDAAILGWVSFSHLRQRDDRVETLRWFGRVTHGPIVVSSLGRRVQAAGPPSRWTRYLPPRRRGRERGDTFAIGTGFYHPLAEDELHELAMESGLRVVYANFDTRDTNWPHAVLARSQVHDSPTNA